MANSGYMGKRIQHLRHQKKLTQQQLADQVGITDSSISKIERGIINPSFKTLQKIADALQTDVVSVTSTVLEMEEDLERKQAQLDHLNAISQVDTQLIIAITQVINLINSSSKK